MSNGDLIYVTESSPFSSLSETIRGVPVQLAQLRANKQYLEATEKLQNTVAMLDGSLSGIEALRELKIELKQQKEVRVQQCDYIL